MLPLKQVQVQLWTVSVSVLAKYRYRYRPIPKTDTNRYRPGFYPIPPIPKKRVPIPGIGKPIPGIGRSLTFTVPKIMTSLNKTLTKERWRLNNLKNIKSITGEQEKVWNPGYKHINMGLLKSTDLKCNSNVIMPQPTNPLIEAYMAKITAVTKTTTEQYLEKIKKKGINLENANFNSQQAKGKDEICGRKDIRILQSDKSNQLAAMKLELYNKAVSKWVKPGDEEISQKQLRIIERENNALIRSLMRMLCMGQDHPNTREIDRLTTSLTSSFNSAAKLDITLKDHKARDAEGNYRTRPLSNCKGSTSEKPSEILVKSLKHLCPDTENVLIRSTEEFQARVEKFNLEIAHVSKCNLNNIPPETKFVLGTMDVDGLYTAVQPIRAGEEIRNAVVKSEVHIKVDYDEMAKYIAVNQTRAQVVNMGLQNVIPDRKYKKGQRPSMLGEEMNRINKQTKSNLEIIEPNITNQEALDIIKTISNRNFKRKRITCYDEPPAKKAKTLDILPDVLDILPDALDILPDVLDILPVPTTTDNTTPYNITISLTQQPTHDHLIIEINEGEKETGNGQPANKQPNKNKRKRAYEINPEEDSSWQTIRKQPNEKEKAALRGVAFGLLVQHSLQNHCYQRGEKIYHQKSGGIIGLDLMRAVS